MSEAFTIDDQGGRVRRLIKPIAGHGGRSISEIRLRQPRYVDYMSIGDPTEVIFAPGAMIPHHDMGLVQRWIETLAQDGDEPMNSGLLNQIDYRDAIALKDAVLDFFKTASANTSTASPTL